MEEGNVSGNRSITDAHKTLLQVFMSKQVMKDEEFNATLEQLKTIYNLRKGCNVHYVLSYFRRKSECRRFYKHDKQSVTLCEFRY